MNTGFLGPAVATVLTVYGIETPIPRPFAFTYFNVATVLTVYGIETALNFFKISSTIFIVATVLTVYGIETQ